MLVIGLTGGIGSGKTTVTNLFAKYDVPIIDTDVIAREITQQHEPAYAEIVQHFGKVILDEQTNINRRALRDIVFTNPAERTWLENLLHPIIRNKTEQQVKRLPPESSYCIVVVPLLTEIGSYPFINRVLVVDAPEASQIERVTARDKTSSTQVQSIIDTQISREKRLKLAHDVITNDGQLEHLSAQVDSLHKKYLEMASL